MDAEARRRAEEIIQYQEGHCLTTDACCDLCAIINYIPDAVAQAVKERDELKHTLELWDKECRGRSPRELTEEITRLREALQRIQHHCAVAATHSAIERAVLNVYLPHKVTCGFITTGGADCDCGTYRGALRAAGAGETNG